MKVDSYICPSCGTEVKVGAVCSGCVPNRNKRKSEKKVGAGPKKRKPWEQDAIYDGIGIPDDEFDYEDFIEREFGKKAHRKVVVKWYWWVTGVVLLGAFGWAVFGGWW